MKKVLFKKWIPQKWKHSNGEINFSRTPIDGESVSSIHQAPGTGCYDSDFIHVGVFHCWGSESQEFDNGAVMDTIAIIERPDGTIEHVIPKHVKFMH